MCDICTFAGANSVTDSALGSKNLHLKLQLQLQLACQASVLGCLWELRLNDPTKTLRP